MTTSPNRQVAPSRMADQFVGDLQGMTSSDLEGLTSRMTSPAYSPQTRASFPPPTSSSASSTCREAPKTISQRTRRPSSRRESAPSRPPGILKTSWDPQVAAKQFDDLCDRFTKTAPTFIAELRKKRDHYLVFLKYPDGSRRSLSTTNTVEAVNGQLEKIRLNSGGYFQSDAVLKLKLGATISTLERTRWAHPSAAVAEALHPSCFRPDSKPRKTDRGHNFLE
jgi:hypothetical protein